MARNTTGYMYKRGKNYWLEWVSDGRRHRRSLRTGSKKKADIERARILQPFQLADRAESVKALQHVVADAEQDHATAVEAARDKLRLVQTWEAFLASPERPDSGETTLQQYEFQWRRFVEWATGEGVALLSEVTADHGKRYASALFASSLSANTANKHVRLCRLVFATLAERERVAVNPFASVRTRKEQQNRRLEFTWPKLMEICDAAEGELKTLLFIGIYTGQRLEDCATLRWQDVDLLQGWIRFVPAKTKRRSGDAIHVPILPDLRAMLEATPEGKRKGCVLPELADYYARDRRDTVTDRVQRLLVKCGVDLYEPGTGPGTDKRAVLRYGFHSLRHTTNTLLLQAGVPPATVQAVTGHRTNAMTARYTHVGRAAIQSAMETLPSINGNVKTSKALPASDQGDRIAEAVELLTTATGRNWRKRIAAAVELLEVAR